MTNIRVTDEEFSAVDEAAWKAKEGGDEKVAAIIEGNFEQRFVDIPFNSCYSNSMWWFSHSIFS